MERTLGLGVGQFGIEQAAFRIEHRQIIGIAVVIAQPGDVGVLAQGVDLILLRRQLPRGMLLISQGIVDLAEPVLDGLLIAEQACCWMASASLTLPAILPAVKRGMVTGAL